MRIDIAQQWADRLQNGGYAQGKGKLRRAEEGAPDKYCCLGVLCELAVEQGIIEPAEINSYVGNYAYSSEMRSVSLPAEVQEWSGLGSEMGMLATQVGDENDLASLNDGGFSFAQIAKIILEQAADL